MGMSAKQLRQRRNRIIQDKMAETRDLDEIKDLTQKSDQIRAHYMTKLYIVVFTAFVVTLMAATNFMKPAFLYKRRKNQPPMHLATLYPPEVVLERDLPRFFRSYTIATPTNRFARKAQVRIVNSRGALKHGTGTLPVLLRAWDETDINLLRERDFCGKDFEAAFVEGSQERQGDLVLWCLLATRVVEGSFLESVEMTNNAFITARKRGMIVQRQRDVDDAPDRATISNAYYLHPRLPGEEHLPMAPLPSKVLKWLFAHPEASLSDPKLALQDLLYQLTSSEENRGRYMILDEVCQGTRPKRSIGEQCSKTGECCYFVVPQREGGKFDDISDDEEDEEAEHRRLLREGMKDD